MIVLLGESGSGKSSIMKRFIEKYSEFHSIIPYTTRPKRDGEVDGVDYNFVSSEVFNNCVKEKEFIEISKYNGWWYGTLKRDYLIDFSHIITICTPYSFRTIKNFINKNYNMRNHIVSFYLSIPRRDRLIKLLERGDNPDEAYRRNLSEVGQFDGVESEVYLPIYNPGYERSVDEIVDFIYDSYISSMVIR